MGAVLQRGVAAFVVSALMAPLLRLLSLPLVGMGCPQPMQQGVRDSRAYHRW